MQNWLLNEKLVGAIVAYKGLSVFPFLLCFSLPYHTSLYLGFIYVLSIQLQLKLNCIYLCL